MMWRTIYGLLLLHEKKPFCNQMTASEIKMKQPIKIHSIRQSYKIWWRQKNAVFEVIGKEWQRVHEMESFFNINNLFLTQSLCKIEQF